MTSSEFALFSVATGYLLREGSDGTPPQFIRVAPEPEPTAHLRHHFLLAHIEDWREMRADTPVSLVETCASLYWTNRARRLSIALLTPLDRSLAVRVTESLERLLQTRVAPDRVLDALLVAPLLHCHRAEQVAQVAAGLNCPAAAALYDKLWDFQPLVRRLCDAWLAVPAVRFLDLSVSKTALWRDASEKGLIRGCLEVDSAATFSSLWNTLQFAEVASSPAGRAALAAMADELSAGLFGRESTRSGWLAEAKEEDARHESPTLERRTRDAHPSPRQRYLTVLRELDEIAEAIAEGRDARAQKFLRELIGRQLSAYGGKEYAIKSLCNLAARCADMFRTDFERVCLDEALAIDPTDGWSLTQLADHLKRVGDFDRAIATFERALGTECELIARTGLADVWAMRGDPQRAIEMFKQIPDWHDMVVVRTAIADNLRRLGELDVAANAYRAITDEFGPTDRVLCGLAEVERRRGALSSALAMYDEILSGVPRDRRALQIYRLQKSGVLAQLGRLPEAYVVVDAIVTEAPFFMKARVARARLLALMGRDLEALADLPAGGGPRAFGEWTRYFYRGLLMLRLERFDEARAALVDQLSAALEQDSARVAVRFGAALALLHDNEVDRAETVLSEIGDVADVYRQYVLQVLWLHLATVRGDRERATTLAQALKDETRGHIVFEETIDAIVAEDWRRVTDGEVRLLLGVVPDWAAAA